MQTLDQGMDCAKAEIASCVEELLSPRAMVLRNDAAVRQRESLPLESKRAVGRVAGDGSRYA